jgi:hypothetical protein
MRLLIAPNSTIAYSDRPVFGVSLTFIQDIERLNFGVIQSGTTLGWADPAGLYHFYLQGSQDDKQISDYFDVVNDVITPKIPLKIFMATSHANIAKMDCLLYFVDAEHQVNRQLFLSPVQGANVASETDVNGDTPDQR